MASTTPFAPNQPTGFNVPQTNVNPNFNLSKNMTIGQFGMPQNSGTNTPNLSQTQGGSVDFGTGKGLSPVVPTSTGFTAGANGLPVATTSAWNSPIVTNHPAASNTNVNPNSALQSQLDSAKQKLLSMQSSLATTPPATNAASQNNNGAGTGGGQPFQGNYTFDANGNVTGTQSAPESNGNYTSPLGQNYQISPQNKQSLLNGDGQSQNSQPDPGTPSSTAAQTNAIIKSLQDTANQGSQGDQAEIDLQNQIQNLQTTLGIGLGNIDNTAEPGEFQVGQKAALLEQRNPELQALTNKLGSLQANRTASITAGTAAAGAGNTLQQLQQQTQPVGIGTGLFSPFSGQTVAQNASYMGGSGSGGTNGIMQGLVQQLQNGAAWSDVVSQLPSAALAPMLSQAAQQAIPGFNPTASNQQAAAQGASTLQTGTIGGQIAKASVSANQALDALQGAFNNLPGAESTGNPLINQLTQGASMLSGFGRNQTSAFQGALQEARTQIDGVLAPLVGVDAAKAQANTLLPDGMIPSEIPNKIQAAKTYIAQKVAAFGQNNNGTSNTGNSSIYNF